MGPSEPLHLLHSESLNQRCTAAWLISLHCLDQAPTNAGFRRVTLADFPCGIECS
jgi:hypothetical protein